MKEIGHKVLRTKDEELRTPYDTGTDTRTRFVLSPPTTSIAPPSRSPVESVTAAGNAVRHTTSEVIQACEDRQKTRSLTVQFQSDNARGCLRIRERWVVPSREICSARRGPCRWTDVLATREARIDDEERTRTTMRSES